MAEDSGGQEVSPGVQPVLEGGTYEIIRQRLTNQSSQLRAQVQQLNELRNKVFGSVPMTLKKAERITTEHNCVPRDMVPTIGNKFIFGHNVQFGLKTTIGIKDVFAVYEYTDESFHQCSLDLLQSGQFEQDFSNLYKYYKETRFAKFSFIGPFLFMVFRVGKNITDIKTFKWTIQDGALHYIDNRSDHEFQFPDQYQFDWKRTHRDLHRYGDHPHISIEDTVFVECVGGDLTIKVEDNTDSGEGIYAEEVDFKDQTLDDAEIYYACVDQLIMLRIRPFQEENFRYFVYNNKLREVHRVDAIKDACVLLPEGHGIIFSSGYYLITGELKSFDTEQRNMMFERMVSSPNGEDFMYVFYNRQEGNYTIMPYNLIEQKVQNPIYCNGFSLFENGELAYFKADSEPQKHHVAQIWQTPFMASEMDVGDHTDHFLYKVGNRDVVRCMAECHEILTLTEREDIYDELYVDLMKRAGDVGDAYFWISNEEAFGIKESLELIRETAGQAIDEFDKVNRLQRDTLNQVSLVETTTRKIADEINRSNFELIDDFVGRLADLRRVRGEIISLRDLRYVDKDLVDRLENDVAERATKLSNECVQFLLREEALEPYRQRVDGLHKDVQKIKKVTEGNNLEEAITASGHELEMLIEIVNNLKIEDSTETTRIIDNITEIFTTINQVKAAVKKRIKELHSVEGKAQFASQMKLISQSVVSFIDLCDTPEKCEEYLNKLMVQLEELEGSFADFDEFVVEISEKRTEAYEAFEARKLNLIESRNRRANSLYSSAERILKVVRHRVDGFDSINEINGYFAADMMVDKIRGIVDELVELGDSVKADDLQSQLKSTQQDGVRQLKDRQELFADGENVIKFGKHKFSVNIQDLDLTIVRQDSDMCLHLTGTKYFFPIRDEKFLETKSVWDQEVVSENKTVYRSEFLASRMLNWLENGGETTVDGFLDATDPEQLSMVQQFMAPRYSEAYTKGIHDRDATDILKALAVVHRAQRLARFEPSARACAAVYWHRFCPKETHTLWEAKLGAFAEKNRVFPGKEINTGYIGDLQALVQGFIEQEKLFDDSVTETAGEYLFHEIINGKGFVVSREAGQLLHDFNAHLTSKRSEQNFKKALEPLKKNPRSQFLVVRDWANGFVSGLEDSSLKPYTDELAALIFCGHFDRRELVAESNTSHIPKMFGSHPVIKEDGYDLNYLEFHRRLKDFSVHCIAKYNDFQKTKAEIIEREREKLRLSEYQPKVLTSFVRNKLIDEVYLPVIGDNLAKQIGSAGESKRTDLMGLLLLISPPGYGKTTLMEYIANRLGLIFMKINGPALGHDVTSLDPQDAGNASSREEVKKLNLSLEMGDNVMIYLDDIQHCNPEFLQKFISLCDAQRRIEGVWEGRPRTYDLRGRKVVVVMAGNPYTESGEKFRIPDMLANRADTYNLGDIIGGSEDAFKASYIENTVTSNPVLQQLSNKSQKDIQTFIDIGESGSREGTSFEATYSVGEINEIVSVVEKLITVRDALLMVNLEYIRSAAMADEYRTEPRFQLQGSYRNMNRLAEKVLPIMNDQEIRDLIMDHYKNESQTLTTGAEANLLKFKEMFELMTGEENARWEEIKKTFNRNQLLGSADQSDPVGRVVAQLTTFHEGLGSIRETLETKLTQGEQKPQKIEVDLQPVVQQLDQLGANITGFTQKVDESKQTHAAQQGDEQMQGMVAQISSVAEQFSSLKKQMEKMDATHERKGKSNKLEKNIKDIEVKLSGFSESLGTIKSEMSRISKDTFAQSRDSFYQEIISQLEPIVNDLSDIKNYYSEELPRQLKPHVKEKHIKQIQQQIVDIAELISESPNIIPGVLRGIIKERGLPDPNKKASDDN